MGCRNRFFLLVAIAAMAWPALAQQNRVRLVWSDANAAITDAQFSEMLAAVLGQHPTLRTSPLTPGGAILDRWASDPKYQNRLESAAAADGKLTASQRTHSLSELSGQLHAIEVQLLFLDGLNRARDKLWPALLTDRLESLERDRQRLEMDTAAKTARAEAIRLAIKQRQEELAAQAENDSVVPQLKAQIAHRKQELQRIEQLQAKGVASSAEAAAAKANLDLVELRLSERVQQLSRQDSAGLLERLKNELTLVTIDLAELRARQEYVQRYAPLLDARRLTETEVESLAGEYQRWYDGNQKLQPLYDGLRERRDELLRRKFALLVDRVERISSVEGSPAASGR